MPLPAAPSPSAYSTTGFSFRLQLLVVGPAETAQAGGDLMAVADEALFQEASGIMPEIGIENFREGGENRFHHRLPTATKSLPLKLSRGIMAADAPLARWCRDVLMSNFAQPVEPRDLRLQLLDGSAASEIILKTWTFSRAWPLRWEVCGLTSTDGRVIVETLEMSCDELLPGKTASEAR